ncbi:6189_t:CDS:2, partial [Racocetra fulgida]
DTDNQDKKVIEAIEDYYDFQQTYLKALINSVPIDTIKEIWKLMVENPSVLFHVMLMPTRWFKDDSWNCLEIISKELFVKAEAQVTDSEGQTLTVRLIDSHVYNVNDVNDPLVRQSKGRPATKRLKAFNEENGSANPKKV